MTEPDARPRRKRSARFIEIAQTAGVSASTVDRVLNERGSVSAAARARVIAAAQTLAVPRVLPDQRHGLLHVDVLLPHNTSPFFGRLNLALQRSMQMLDRRVVIHRVVLPETDEDAMVEAIVAPRHRRAALIVTSHDTPRVRAALAKAAARGEAIATLVTDVDTPARLHYAGIDNRCAGGTAGYFVGRLAARAGRVLLLASRMDYRAHIERIGGCRDVIAARYPALDASEPPVEMWDDADACYRATRRALKRGNLSAVYNSGYGSEGVEAALRHAGVDAQVVWVGHEMLDAHRDYIERGSMDVVIDQDPDGQVICALQHVLRACGVVSDAPPPGPVEFRLFCPVNVRREAYLPPA